MGLLDDHREVPRWRAVAPALALAASAVVAGACAAQRDPALRSVAALPRAIAVQQVPDYRRYRCDVTRVIDGDSFTADIDMGFGLVFRDQAFRVDGIDTPELHSKVASEREAAAAARDLLRAMLLDATVVYAIVDERNPREKFGRILARVELGDGTDVGKTLISEGLAKPYDGGKR